MNELSQNPLFFLLIGAVLLLLILLFMFMRKSRDVQELSQDLQKNVLDFNQLASRFDLLNQAKNQLDQALIQAQTQGEGLQTRLQERDEKIQFLQQELNEEQARHERIGVEITALKERFGVASAQAEELRKQLDFNQQQLGRKEQDWLQLNQQYQQRNQELTELKTTLSQKEQHFAEQLQTFAQSKQQLSVEFQNLANQILEEKSQRFSQSNQSALDSLLKPFREQIEGFQKRVNEIHSEALKGNASLEQELKKMLEVGMNMSQEANNLTSALKGEKKTLGNWGEMQLERALQLAGLLAGEHYQAQAHFKNESGKHNYPDFVVNLPDDKHLIIDSKMSLNAYERAVNAEDEIERQKAFHEHIKALKNHIEDLARKDYSNLIGVRSPNFVLMFVGIEPAYIEALKQDPSLFNYGYERNVILVSHTTLMPILRTVANLWRIERGNAEAREISEKAGDIYNQICLVAERLARLGNSLNSISGQYNDTVTALVGKRGLIGKVERFKDLSAKANKAMPVLEPLQTEVDVQRLGLNQEE